MTVFSLHHATVLGAVHLTVTDLGRALDFYRGVLGLSELARDGATVILTANGRSALVGLVELPGARPKPARATGLYHYAMLLPQRRDLARVAQRFLETRYPVQGASDHGVSEALYLADPDGNGIEIYVDRPRMAWPMLDGQLQMVTDPLDFAGLIQELAHEEPPWTGLPASTCIGHVHLHVRDLREAEKFYREALGLDLVQRLGPSAAFLSAGGYHHHVGINTWAGIGAPQPPADAVGLRYFTVSLPSRAALEQMIAHLRSNGLAPQELLEGLLLRDPSGNGLVLTRPAFDG